MTDSNTVYDSTPMGGDLSFVFSTRQNGEDLDYTDTIFVFRLFDARQDLTGNLLEDMPYTITTLDSSGAEDNFILDEEEQAVAVTVPWDLVELYEEQFSGDVHGVLEANTPPATAVGFRGYFENRPGRARYTTSQLDSIKSSIMTSVSRSEADLGNLVGGDDVCLGSYDPITGEYIPPQNVCFCSIESPINYCGDVGLNSPYGGVVSWVPFSVELVSLIAPPPFTLGRPADPCNPYGVTVRILMAGMFSSCQPLRDPPRGVGSPVIVRTFRNMLDPLSLTWGWNEWQPFRRQPEYHDIGTLVVNTDHNEYTEPVVQDILVPILNSRYVDKHTSTTPPPYSAVPPTLVTLDIGTPYAGLRINEKKTGNCYPVHEILKSCDCGCPVMSLPDIPREPFWKIAKCDIPEDLEELFDDAANCTGQRPEGRLEEWTQDPFYRNQLLWKNYYMADQILPIPREVDEHEWVYPPSGVFRGVQPPAPPDWPWDLPDRYVSWPDPFFEPIPRSESYKKSDYFPCGGKYHMWIRFTDIE